MDWQALAPILRTVAAAAIALALFFLVRKEQSLPKGAKIFIWAAIWAIGGAIIGQADDEIEVMEAALLGACWGALLAGISLSGWSLWKQ
jgi:hypothetical protein